ncbi:MAG: DUF2218 domain-containing protein [Rhodospirillales bacterium]
MIESRTRIETAQPGRYLGQLCKHFAHKLPVSYDAAHGRIEFPSGICQLDADGDALAIRTTSPDAEQLMRLQDVVIRHLERFAFRETLSVTWTQG